MSGRIRATNFEERSNSGRKFARIALSSIDDAWVVGVVRVKANNAPAMYLVTFIGLTPIHLGKHGVNSGEKVQAESYRGAASGASQWAPDAILMAPIGKSIREWKAN